MTTTTIDNRTVIFSDAILKLQPQSLLTALVKDFIESGATDCEMYNLEDMFKAVLIMVSDDGDIHVVHPTEVTVQTVTLVDSGFINESNPSPVTIDEILKLHHYKMLNDVLDELLEQSRKGELDSEEAADRIMKFVKPSNEQLG